MRTHYVSTLELDHERLAKDLSESESFRYSEAYSDYLIGGPWKSCMLFASGGEAGSGVVTSYAHDAAGTFTEYGRRLPYLQELICETADLSRLTFVRLAVFSDSVIIPHRDYLELEDIDDDVRPAHRLHIPLVTHDQCLFSDRDTVYRMREGQIWFFDAAELHSVASFANAPRIHLIFDFVERPGSRPLVSVPDVGSGPEAGITQEHVVERAPLPEADRAAIAGLADVLTRDTFREVFSIVIKKHFRYDCGPNFAWDTIVALARACKDPDVLPHADELRRYYTLERSA